MLHGALVYVDKDKKGERLVGEAIQKGLRLYERHYGRVPALELVALVSPGFYNDCKLSGQKFQIDLEWHDGVPYGNLWVCKIGDIDYDRSR